MKKLAIIFILAFGLMASSTIADSSSSSLVDAEPKYLTSDTFNQAINTSGASWNTGIVQDMSSMFEGALLFTQDI